MQWRVKPVLPVTKLIAAVAVAALAAVFAGADPVRWALAGVTGCGLVVWALRDVLVPVRLTADADGVTVVTGFARRRHLRWSEVERLRVDRTARRGLRSELLEIDAGDAIYLFSAHELGAAPEDVRTALASLRA
ncbi:PH domain-containing protein [Actinoplanes teichomyceticus]|uniref:PH (Pleckstrin Homology) domain-containing protein n=1 Tax=Actinoplanes teichomyceticus TaxID=1867 RepID=A0A561WR46_ACTTI|nr:PH domain-containing protein [Actinoplanes teichomyceticus]TWG26337.1 PH (Pleckstrin Homology) domain-containing protein [Actinoplanes teichomyceticus]GIF11415.1 hypothetical protein Ate01nite_14470 [Actinoplanes teichomyceticus]